MGIAHVREEGMRLLPSDGFAAMIGKLSGCQRDTLHPGSAVPVPAARQGPPLLEVEEWRFGTAGDRACMVDGVHVAEQLRMRTPSGPTKRTCA